MKTVFPAFALSCTLLLSLASCCNSQSSASQEDHSTLPASSSMASGSGSQADDQDTALEQEVASLLSAFPAENVRVEQTDARLSVSAFDPAASAVVTAAQETAAPPLLGGLIMRRPGLLMHRPWNKIIRTAIPPSPWNQTGLEPLSMSLT